MKLANIGGITSQKAMQIIDQVKDATSKWEAFAIKAHMSPESKNSIQLALNRVLKNS
jgi:hypothetical protein